MGGWQLEHNSKLIGFYTQIPVMCHWSLEDKLNLESRNQKIQYGCQMAILKVTQLIINRLLSIATNNMHMKFETENPNQTPATKLSPESEKSNMATSWPFWKWRQCKSIDFYPYTQRLCYWTLELIFKAKLKVESGNQNILNGHQGLALLTLSWDKNWDSHSLVNGYPSFYPRIALVAPSPGGHFGSDVTENQ